MIRCEIGFYPDIHPYIMLAHVADRLIFAGILPVRRNYRLRCRRYRIRDFFAKLLAIDECYLLYLEIINPDSGASCRAIIVIILATRLTRVYI